MSVHEYLVQKMYLSDIPFTDMELDVYRALRSRFPKKHYVLVDKYVLQKK